MINGKRILAVIPARSGSKGLPDKNIRPLCGKPLLAWPIETALKSSYVDKVIISTDSLEYANIAKAYGAEVPFMRPDEFANDLAPSIDYVLHAIQSLADKGESFDYLILLEPTSPLTEVSDIDDALEELLKKKDQATAAIGVAIMETQHPSYAVTRNEVGLVKPISGDDFSNLPRRQDLEPIFVLEGSFYISTIAALIIEKSFYHSQTLGIIIEKNKAFEVDDLVDFICIEAILKHRLGIVEQS